MTNMFDPSSDAAIARLIANYPLAWVVSRDFQATPLPLIGETDDTGAIVSLLGHFALRNPQVTALRTDPAALILFQGPQGYISPRTVSNPTWGPTWNYAVARFEVDISLLPDATDHALEQLAIKLEGAGNDAWKPSHMGPRYAQLSQAIIAFRAHVRTANVTFKLGQDENPETFGEIVAGLHGNDLALWMAAEREA